MYLPCLALVYVNIMDILICFHLQETAFFELPPSGFPTASLILLPPPSSLRSDKSPESSLPSPTPSPAKPIFTVSPSSPKPHYTGSADEATRRCVYLGGEEGNADEQTKDREEGGGGGLLGCVLRDGARGWVRAESGRKRQRSCVEYTSISTTKLEPAAGISVQRELTGEFWYVKHGLTPPASGGSESRMVGGKRPELPWWDHTC